MGASAAFSSATNSSPRCHPPADSPSAALPTTTSSAVDAFAAILVPAEPMLRCLALCRDVQFVLMQMLALEDLAALDSTCRIWRQWLLHPPLLGGLQFERNGTLLQLLPLSQCDWTRQLVTGVDTLLADDDRGSVAPLPEVAGEAKARDAAAQFLALLPRFTRLHTLVLCLCGELAGTLQLWSSCFASLAASLRELDLDARGCDRHSATALNAALAHIGLLRQLSRLSIVLECDEDAVRVNLSQLPSLPRLATFDLMTQENSSGRVEFRCTPMQTQCLAQCSRLTDLNCGAWSPDERTHDDEGEELPPHAQQIQDGIATLVRGLLTSAEGSAPSNSCVSADAAAAAATPLRGAIQYFHLSSTAMSAAVWEHVSQLTSLVELHPLWWRSDLSTQQWARLADFTQLQSIRLVAHPHDDSNHTHALLTEHFLPSLLQCTQLTSVILAGSALSLSTVQLESIIASLPQLHTLVLSSLHIESAQPLGAATRLTTLHLLLCSGPAGVIDFRRSLPTLPSLTALKIHDRSRITAAQAAPLNAALFARMPRLTSSRFGQNLCT